MPDSAHASRPAGAGDSEQAAAANGLPDPGGQGAIALEPAVLDRAALMAALDPIITADEQGEILSASNSVRRVLGWTSAELVGRNVKVLMPEPHYAGHDGFLSEYRRTGHSKVLNRPQRLEALRKDGSRVPVELSISRAEIPGTGRAIFVAIIRDMSDYAAAERSQEEERGRSQRLLAEQTRELKQANLRLRMADRMAAIGTLAAGLGHDMNNVLLPVRARLNALRAAGRAGDIPAAERRHVDEVRKSVAYLQQLADGLHFLALDPETDEDVRGGGAVTDLRHWWSQAGALLSKAVPRHVRVSASFPPGLPTVAIAAHGLSQAVLNLVVNAGEAIPGPEVRKRRQGRVHLSAKPVKDADGSWVQLSVTDNGSGMSDEVMHRAFEMFYTTKPRGLGTGLGLPLVRRVVERAHGRVEIESGVEKGTTVRLILPVSGADSRPEQRSERPVAVISLGDGRTSAVVRQLLEVLGALVHLAREPGIAQIWVVDPASASPEAVGAWRARQPKGKLVLFGRVEPEAAEAWSKWAPIQVSNPDDFDSVRAALGRAVSER